MNQHSKDVLFGILFGAWLGGIYSFSTMAFNMISLPGIPLKPVHGNNIFEFLGYYCFIGAVLGLISSLPHNPWLGMVAGGASSSFILSISILFTSSLTAETVFRTLFAFVYTFLPMSVILMPAAGLIRIGVNAQHPDPDRPELWARRYLWPFLVTVVTLVVGSFALYSADQRAGFRQVNTLIVENRGVSSVDALPKSLQTVQGYIDGAKGPYALSLSDRLEDFMGPQPVGDQLSQYLIVADFETGLRFACIFQPGVTVVPYCTNF
jgi:hypothetical protein